MVDGEKVDAKMEDQYFVRITWGLDKQPVMRVEQRCTEQVAAQVFKRLSDLLPALVFAETRRLAGEW